MQQTSHAYLPIIYSKLHMYVCNNFTPPFAEEYTQYVYKTTYNGITLQR